MTTIDPIRTRELLVARHLVRSQLFGLEVLLVAFMLVVAAVGLAIHLIVGLSGSVWAGAVQFMRWFSVGMGVYLTAVYLPVYVAHGRTRREIAMGSAIFALLLAAWLGAAVLVGSALEVGVYRLLGWAALLPDPHPVGSLAQIATTFAEHSTAFLIWLCAGALGGAAFYRSPVIGLAVAPFALALLGLAELLRDRPLPFDALPDAIADPTLPVVVSVGLAAAAAAMALTWPIIRDVPLRPRAG